MSASTRLPGFLRNFAPLLDHRGHLPAAYSTAFACVVDRHVLYPTVGVRGVPLMLRRRIYNRGRCTAEQGAAVACVTDARRRDR